MSSSDKMGGLASDVKYSGEAGKIDPWAYKVPGFHVYNGVVMGDSSPADYLGDVRNMPLFEDDVFVISYPKSGTTMLQEMIWLTMTNGDLERANQTSTFFRVPFCDYIFPPDDNGLLNAAATERPRLLKTHLAFHLAPKQIMEKDIKTFYVMRNPKDVLVSYYYFYKSTVTFGKFPGSWDQFFEMFRVGNIYWGDVFDHVKSWWEQRDHRNMKFMMFEDMVQNPRKCVEEIAEFLNVELTEEVLNKIVEATSFKTMQANPATNGKNLVAEIDYEISPFMRKGTIGDWHNHFSDEQAKIMDEIIETKLAGTGLKFVYDVGQNPK